MRKFILDYHLAKITGILHEDLSTFLITSRSVLLRLRNISDTICKENQNKHKVQKRLSESRAVYEIMWKNMVQPDGHRPQYNTAQQSAICMSDN